MPTEAFKITANAPKQAHDFLRHIRNTLVLIEVSNRLQASLEKSLNYVDHLINDRAVELRDVMVLEKYHDHLQHLLKALNSNPNKETIQRALQLKLSLALFTHPKSECQSQAAVVFRDFDKQKGPDPVVMSTTSPKAKCNAYRVKKREKTYCRYVYK